MSVEDRARFEAIEARVDALGATVRSVLTTLVLRGVLNRADLAVLLQETATALEADGAKPSGIAELKAIEAQMPSYLRAAIGPPPDPDADDH